MKNFFLKNIITFINYDESGSSPPDVVF